MNTSHERTPRTLGLEQRTLAAGLGLVLSLGLFGCQAESEPEVSGKKSSSKGNVEEVGSNYVVGLEMKGYIDPVYGSRTQNRCAVDVVGSMRQIPYNPTGSRYDSKAGQQLPPEDATLHTFENWNNHIQGVTRIAGFDDNRWLAVSRAHDMDRAGIFLVHMADMAGSDGTRMLPPGVDFASSAPERASQFYYPIYGTRHPGGMSSAGTFVAVAVEGEDSAWIEFYDFSRGTGSEAALGSFTLGNSDEVPTPSTAISGVALTRLSNEHYLLFVLGKDTSEDGWFYMSDSTELDENTEWEFVDYVDKSDSTGSFGRYQNAQFITECDSGDVYMLLSGNDTMKFDASSYDFSFIDEGQNETLLFKLSTTTETIPETPRLQHSAVHLEWMLGGRFSVGNAFECSMRAAAAPFVDRDGNLILYCHAHKAATHIDVLDAEVVGDSELKWSEFAYDGCTDGNCCNGDQTACGAECCNSTDTCILDGQGAGSCCAAENTCGDSCCGAADSCVDGACCTEDKTCGTACCGAEEACKDPSQSLCCGAFSTLCGSGCCDTNEDCVDGACVVPAPPVFESSCPSNPDLACSTVSDCGPRFSFCNGCCQVLR